MKMRSSAPLSAFLHLHTLSAFLHTLSAFLHTLSAFLHTLSAFLHTLSAFLHTFPASQYMLAMFGFVRAGLRPV